MMEFMRKMAPAIIVVVILVFGGTSFVVFGTNSAQLKEANKPIGTIGSEDVSLLEFQQAYNKTLNNMRNQDMTDAQRRQLPMRVWEELERQAISKQIAESMLLEATSAEVLMSLLENPPAMLKQSPYFADEKTGQFSETKYRQIMSDPATYDIPEIRYLENYLRERLPEQKVMNLVELNNFVSPSEVAEQYHRSNDSVQFEYLTVRPFSFVNDINEKITDDAVSSYYEANREDFETEEKAELYFIKISKTATAYDEKVITDELATIKSNILSGETTFEVEADIESDDAQTAANGGSLSWMTKGDFAAFDPIFDLKVGEISEPIKSPLGIHIVRVDSIDTENEKGRMKLSHIMKLIVPTVATLDSLDALSENVLNTAEDKGIVAASELDSTLVLDSTGLFARGDAVAGVGYHNGLGAFAFDGDDETPFEMFENENAYYLVTVKEKVEAGVLPLERVDSKVKRILRDSLSLEAAKNYLADAAKKAGADFEAFAANDDKIAYGKSETITREVAVPGVGRDNKVIATAFGTELNAVSDVVAEPLALFVVRPLSKKIAENMSDSDKKAIASKIKSERKKTLFNEWYAQYRENLGVTQKVRNYYY